MLLNEIKKHQLNSRIAKDNTKTALLTTLIGDAEMVGKNAGRETTDDEVVAVIKKFLKNNAEFQKHLTADAAGLVNLKVEQTILESYLPQQLSEVELDVIISNKFAGDLKPQKGAIMKFLKENYAGKYDGATASKVIG